jgi:hypothetical protein
MSYGLVGLYALYLMFVGVNGHASELFTDIEQDAKGFAPWLIAILVLRALSNSSTLKPMVTPFIGLAVLTFALRNYGVIVQQVDQITGLALPTGNLPASTYNNLSNAAQVQNDVANSGGK